MRRPAPSSVSQRSPSPREGHKELQGSPSTSPHLTPKSLLLVPPHHKPRRGGASASAGSFPKKNLVSISGASPPLYALASGALYGNTTSNPKYVLTQIALLQSAFYLVYALLALIALTFLIDLGGGASNASSTGGGLLVLEGDVAPKPPYAAQNSSSIRIASEDLTAALAEGSVTPADSAKEKVDMRVPSPELSETFRGTSARREKAQHDTPQRDKKHADFVTSAHRQDRLPDREHAVKSRGKRGFRGLRRSRVLFDTKLYSFQTQEGRVLLLVFFITSVAMSYLVFLVVERARKCLDFCFSIHFLHFLACWALSGFPRQLSWWLCSLGGAIATTALSQFLCQRVELQEIRLERASTPSPPLRMRSLSEGQNAGTERCTFRLPPGVAVNEQSQPEAYEPTPGPTAPQVYGLAADARDCQCLQDPVSRARGTETRSDLVKNGIELRIV